MLPHLTGRSVGTDGVIFVGREICRNLQESFYLLLVIEKRKMDERGIKNSCNQNV